jgi:hypothetical protein
LKPLDIQAENGYFPAVGLYFNFPKPVVDVQEVKGKKLRRGVGSG